MTNFGTRTPTVRELRDEIRDFRGPVAMDANSTWELDVKIVKSDLLETLDGRIAAGYGDEAGPFCLLVKGDWLHLVRPYRS